MSKPSAPQPSPKPQLETPTARSSPAQETGTPAGTGQKQEGEPTQKLQLETPKEAPATQQKLETPVAPGPARSEQQQAVVEDIIFRGNRRIPAATLRARILSHKGNLYDENALEQLHGTVEYRLPGRYPASRSPMVRRAERSSDFYVREKKLIRSIDYKGLKSVQTSDVLDVFKKRKVGLSIQSQYDPVVVKRAEVTLRELLAAHGRQFTSAIAAREISSQLRGLDLHRRGGPQSQGWCCPIPGEHGFFRGFVCNAR